MRVRKIPAIALAAILAGQVLTSSPPATAASMLPTGTVFSWGYAVINQLARSTPQNQPIPTPGATSITDAVAVAASLYWGLALKTNGTVVAWGDNFNGQLGDPSVTDGRITTVPNLSGVTAIAAGDTYGLALKSDGTVWRWGRFNYGPISAVAQVPGLSGVTQIAAGWSFALALKTDGSVWAWGANTSGQLGNGTLTDSPTPTRVVSTTGLTRATKIAASYFHTLAINQDGALYAWGDNANGQLGDQTTTNRSAPVFVSSLGGGVTQIATGGNFSLAVDANGWLWSWGRNNHGQLGTGDYSELPRYPRAIWVGLNPRAIIAGFDLALAIVPDGTLVGWGNGQYGQLGNPLGDRIRLAPVPGITGPLSVVAAGREHTLAINPHPETSILSGPVAVTQSRSATFTFSANETASLECALGTAAFATCSSPVGYSGLADGPYTFKVRATDVDGVVDPTPAVSSWRVDNLPPDTTVLGPSGPWASTTASFSFASTDPPSTFQCSFNGSAFASCTTPTVYSNLSNGVTYSFQVRATDAAANTDASPASRTFTVDVDPPDTTIVYGPSGYVASSSATLSFTATEAATFRCSLDGGAASACTSPKTYTGLAGGPHTFTVAAIDLALNPDLTPATRAWTSDTTPPALTLTRPAGGVYVLDQEIVKQGSTPVIVGAVTVLAKASDAESGIDAFRFEIDGVPVDGSAVTYNPETQTYEFLWSPLSSGVHTVTARATNRVALSTNRSIQVIAVQV